LLVLRQILPNGNDNGVLAVLETGDRAIFCVRFTGVWGGEVIAHGNSSSGKLLNGAFCVNFKF